MLDLLTSLFVFSIYPVYFWKVYVEEKGEGRGDGRRGKEGRRKESRNSNIGRERDRRWKDKGGDRGREDGRGIWVGGRRAKGDGRIYG